MTKKNLIEGFSENSNLNFSQHQNCGITSKFPVNTKMTKETISIHKCWSRSAVEVDRNSKSHHEQQHSCPPSPLPLPPHHAPPHPPLLSLHQKSSSKNTQGVTFQRCDVCGWLTATEGARLSTGGALQLDGSLSASLLEHTVMHWNPAEGAQPH